MTKKITGLLLGMLGFCSMGYAQHEQCGSMELINSYIKAHPEAAEALARYNAEILQRTAEVEKMKTTSAQKTTEYIVQIPIVYHIVLTQAQIDEIGGTAGISQRAQSQIDVLNRDFNGVNTDTVPAVFQPLKGNAGFNFAIVHTNTSGHGTSGIEYRIMSPGFAGYSVQDASLKYTLSGGMDPWDNQKYLNVWICDITTTGGGEILGYAYSPSYAKTVVGDTKLMGVVIDYKAFGKRQSAADVYFANNDRGRTMVHEMGHYFTLWHIWGNTTPGSGSCGDDDDVSDTPVQKDANQSLCPGYPKINCNNTTGGEMFMNYMDYVTDFCMRMFSKGQVNRMQSEFRTGGGSYNLQFNGGLMSWPSGISELEKKSSFDIIPNPSFGEFHLAFNNDADALHSITIINSFGQTVKTINNINSAQKSITIDLSDNPKGLYSVKCAFESGLITRNVVLQ